MKEWDVPTESTHNHRCATQGSILANDRVQRRAKRVCRDPVLARASYADSTLHANLSNRWVDISIYFPNNHFFLMLDDYPCRTL